MNGAAAAKRLQDRLGLGPTPQALAWGASVGPGPVARELLGQVPDDSIVDLGPQPADLIVDGRTQPEVARRINLQQARLADWWIDRLVTTDRPFTEKLTWFWHGHFATAASIVSNPNLMAVQNRTQRRLGAGSFVELVQAMTVDPAMLVWLNGVQNRAGAPNENLGRELMELFTLGVGRYTETDVKEAARTLTGWTVDQYAFTSALDPAGFDPGPKTVLGTPVGDARSLVSLLTSLPASAEFVVRRLWRRYVSTAAPPPADAVARLTAAFGPERDVRALMRALAEEPAMLDPSSTVVKQPLEWAVGLMRATGVRPSTLDDPTREVVRAWLQSMGQLPFEPPDVGGWTAGDGWLSTASAHGRWWLAGVLSGFMDLSALAATAPDARPAYLARLLGVDRWTARSTAAMRTVAADPRAVLSVAASAPEYVVSR